VIQIACAILYKFLHGRITQAVNSWLNKTVEYVGKEISFSYLIFLKTREFAHFLSKKTQNFDFLTPKFTLNRQDSDKIRRKIVKISYVKW